MKLEITVYKVRDPNGNVRAAACADSYDTIMLGNMYDEDNNYIQFEDEAKNLESWCEEYGCELTEKKIVIEL